MFLTVVSDSRACTRPRALSAETDSSFTLSNAPAPTPPARASPPRRVSLDWPGTTSAAMLPSRPWPLISTCESFGMLVLALDLQADRHLVFVDLEALHAADVHPPHLHRVALADAARVGTTVVTT